MIYTDFRMVFHSKINPLWLANIFILSYHAPCQQDKTRGFHWPLGALGYSIFYQYRDMDVKVLGSYDYDFFQGFISRCIIFQGVNLHSYLFQGGRLKFLFIGIIFSQGSNCLRFNSRVFMNQQSFFPGHIDF